MKKAPNIMWQVANQSVYRIIRYFPHASSRLSCSLAALQPSGSGFLDISTKSLLTIHPNWAGVLFVRLRLITNSMDCYADTHEMRCPMASWHCTKALLTSSSFLSNSVGAPQSKLPATCKTVCGTVAVHGTTAVRRSLVAGTCRSLDNHTLTARPN